LRKDGGDATEFVALTLFENMEAVRDFAGEDYTAAVVPEESRKLLARFDQRSVHYKIVFRSE